MINLAKRWCRNWPTILKDIASFMGTFWLIIELLCFFLPRLSSHIRGIDYFLAIIILGIIYGIRKNFPRSSFEQKIRNKDSHIEIKIGDAFKNNGALIIPFNNEFDVSLNGNVKTSKSLQNKLLSDSYDSDATQLKEDISKKINLTKKPFDSGTVVEIRPNEKTFYLLVNSKKKKNNRTASTIDDFMLALNGMWNYLSCDAAKNEIVTIPLLNTLHGRNSDLTREVVTKQIIDTFIDESKHKMVTDKLIISIHPSDIKKGQLDFDELGRYLEFQCKNYKNTKFDNKPEGKKITPSTIKSIEE